MNLPARPACQLRSAGDDFDLLEARKFLRTNVHLVQKNAAGLLPTRPSVVVADGARLLEDLLEHEVLVARTFSARMGSHRIWKSGGSRDAPSKSLRRTPRG